MAVTAKFQADFSDFLRKTQQAGDSLENLQKAAGSTTSTVQRLATSFSGERMIRSAADSVEAVKMLGGVATLSQAEMQRLGTQVNEATQKMERMGITVPSAMKLMQAEIAKATEPSMWEKAKGALDKFGLSVGLISGGALLAFGKVALDAADKIGDIAEKTGFTTDEVQRFQQGFEGAGITVEDFAKGAQKLSMKIAGGGDSTVAALTSLGLSLADLRTKSPGEAMQLVSTALAGVADQGTKTLLVNDLMGKGLAQSAGAFNEVNVAAMNNAAIIGGDAVGAAGDFANAQTHLTRVFQKFVVEGVAPLLPALSLLMEWLGKLGGYLAIGLTKSVDAAVIAFSFLKKAIFESMIDLIENFKRLPFAESIPGFEKITGALAYLKEGSKNASDEIQKRLHPALVESTSKAATTTIGMKALGEAIEVEVDPAVQRLTESFHKQIEAHEKLKSTIDKVAATPDWFKLQKASFTEGAPILARTIDQTAEIAKKTDEWAKANLQVIPAMHSTQKALEAMEPQTTKLGAAFKNLGATIVNAFTNGGDALKAIGSSLGGALGEDIGAKLAKGIGGKLGEALGSAMGPLGALAGSLLGKAAGWFGGLFGGDDKKKQEDAAKKAAEAQAAIDRMKASMADLQAQATGAKDEIGSLIGKAADMGYILNEQGDIVGVKFQKMSELAKQYGVDLGSLGATFQQQQLSSMAGQLIQDFDLLTRGGADVGGVLLGMQDEVQKLVDQSIKFGVDIPENMQPMIKGLIEAGKLTGENGEKLTDLAQLKFGAPVKTEFDKIKDALAPVIDKLQELVDKIGAMAQSIAAATQSRTVNTHFTYTYDQFNPPGDGEGVATGGGIGASGRVQRFARGGTVGGMGEGDSVPAMLTPGEGVLSRKGMQALSKLNGGGGVGADPALRNEMRAMREEFADVARGLRDMPRSIQKAVANGLLFA